MKTILYLLAIVIIINFCSCEKKKLEDTAVLPQYTSKLYIRCNINGDSVNYSFGENKIKGVVSVIPARPNPLPWPTLYVLDVVDEIDTSIIFFKIQISNYQLTPTDYQSDLNNTIKPGIIPFFSIIPDTTNPYMLNKVALFYKINKNIYSSALPNSINKFQIISSENLTKDNNYYRSAMCKFECNLHNVINPFDSVILRNGEASLVFGQQ